MTPPDLERLTAQKVPLLRCERPGIRAEAQKNKSDTLGEPPGSPLCFPSDCTVQ